MSEQDTASCSNQTNDVLIKERKKPMSILMKFLRGRKARREDKYDAQKPVDPGNPLPKGSLYKIKHTAKEPKMKPRYKLYAIQRSSSLSYNVPPNEALNNPGRFFQNEETPVERIDHKQFRHAKLFGRNEPVVDHSVPRLDERKQRTLADERAMHVPSEPEIKDKIRSLKKTSEEKRANEQQREKTLVEPVDSSLDDSKDRKAPDAIMKPRGNHKVPARNTNNEQPELETKYAYNDEIKKEIVKTHEFLKVHRSSLSSNSSSESHRPSVLIIEKPASFAYVQPQHSRVANRGFENNSSVVRNQTYSYTLV
jgi:hypothetical protein